MIEKPLLAPEFPTIANEIALYPDHPVARDDK
jgi:hypothetical protein